jgi:hypothetical protein
MFRKSLAFTISIIKCLPSIYFKNVLFILGSLNRTDYDPYIKQHAPEHLQHAWFSSPGFAFYGIQRELLVGSFSSLIASLGIALLVLFLTSGNLFIALYALLTITFAIGKYHILKRNSL